jgi:translocation and assembly module TamB
MSRIAKIAGWIFGAFILAVLAAFAVVQTGPGRRLVADSLNHALAGPDSVIEVGAITGVVPFNVSVSRITLSDKLGPWLRIDNATLRWSPSALLEARLLIDRLSADRVDVLRPPTSNANASNPPTGGFTLPHLPLAVDLRNLVITRLAVAPALAGGDYAEATVAAHGTLMHDRAAVTVALSRADGQRGSGLIDGRYDEAANTLALRVDIDEPTGIAMDALTGGTDHRPLRVTLDGGGKLAGWSGTLRLTSGADVAAEARLNIAHEAGTRVAITGTAAFAPLLAENLRPLVGDRVTFSIAGAEDGRGGLTLAPSHVALASMTVNAQGGRSDNGAVNGTAHVAVPNLSLVGAAAEQGMDGAIGIDAVLSGTAALPRLALSEHGAIVFGRVAFDGLTVDANIEGTNSPNAKDPRFGLTVDAKADTMRDAEDGAGYGPLSLHLAGAGDIAGTRIDARQLDVHGGGIAIDGDFSLDHGAGAGKATVDATDLAVLGRLLDRPLAGAIAARLTVRTAPDATITAEVSGTGDRLRTGVAAADALLAGPVKLAASLTATPAGKLAVSALSVESSRARLEASGGFDPAGRAINARIAASLADLKSVAGPLGGSGNLSATLGGTLDAPTIDARATLDHLAFRAMRIDHLDATVAAPGGVNGTATINARINSGRLTETIAAGLSRQSGSVYRLSDFRMNGTGGTASGAVMIDLAGRMLTGKLDGAIGDLSVWSDALGEPASGRITFAIDLPAKGRGPVRVAVDHLAVGTGPDATGIGHALLTGSASGDLARPSGTLELAIGGVAAAGVAITEATARVSAGNGAEDFQLRATGHAGETVSVAMTGTASQDHGTSRVRVASLSASLGVNHMTLEQPLTLTIAPNSYSVAGLALDVDGGKITGRAALSAQSVAADISLSRLPLHPLGVIVGKDEVGGTIDGRITMAGTARTPEAHLSLTTTGLDLETDGPLPRPSLALAATADWNGDRANLNARLSSASGETLAVGGSVPLAIDLATFALLDARDKTLAITVKGGGRLENLASILPLGEDRVSGAFTVDLAVGGTIAAPTPSGRIAVTGGAYADMALGSELSGIDLAIDGAGQRFVLDHLNATDGKTGTLKASGSVDLAVKPASVALDLAFTDFRVTQTDDATINADGDLRIGGSPSALKASGTLTVRRADLYIPDSLPASVASLNVIEIGGKRTVTEAARAKPVEPVALQIALDAPGRIFVRGHGISSEWRGHVDISGSSAAPVLNGELVDVNGTINLLGQNFTIDRGIVRFGGGTGIDPVLDAQASATASSVTATVSVSGTAQAPKIALSSVPALPQDEILAQVLFGSNVSALTASQGLQLAAAAASLAQGGPGMLDRVRDKIGLDRLDFGGGTGNGTQGAATGTTVTGGKYIANGVLVGVSQGITANSTQALVQVEVTPHISVNSTFGTASGSGFGAKYSIDY